MFFLLNKNLEKRKIEENNKRKMEEIMRRRKEENFKRKMEEKNIRNGIIFNLKEAKATIIEEKLDVCVVSYGGSCSNQLVDALIKNNYNCRTPLWDKILCHCPYFVDLGIPIIYIYDNPIKSFLSMKNRDSTLATTNQIKLSNNVNVEISDDNLLTLMFKQFSSFKSCGSNNVLLIQSNELFHSNILHKLRLFLRNPTLDFFPIEYITPKNSLDNLGDSCYNDLFQKYKEQIKVINEMKQQLIFKKIE